MSGLGLVATLVGTLLGGGLIGVLLKYILDSKRLTNQERHDQHQQRRDDFQIILDLVSKQRDEAYRKFDALELKYENLEMEVRGLRLAHDLDPFPHWIVDLEGRYIFVNVEFEKQFLVARGWSYRDMIGQQHEKLWPTDFCLKLKQLDGQARSRPDGRARATTVVNGQQVTVHKFPVRVKGAPVAYAGYITHIEDLEPEGAAK